MRRKYDIQLATKSLFEKMSANVFRIFRESITKNSRSPFILTFMPGNAALRYLSFKFSSSCIINCNFSCLKSVEQLPLRSSVCLHRDRSYNNLHKTSQRCMAGHAKWQNVKHIKASKDTQKTILCSRYARLVSIAVRENGPDPKLNSKLADIISEAHKHNVPNSALESAMKKGSNAKMKSGMIEIVGPGGCFVVLEYETDNISIMRNRIKNILKKHGSSIPQGEGRWRASFERKGILKIVGNATNEPLTADKALDSAIEAGAEEVQLKIDENDETRYLEFICAPDGLHSVKKELEGMSYKIEEAYIAYIPYVLTELSEENMEITSSMLSGLEELPEVVRLYENIQ